MSSIKDFDTLIEIEDCLLENLNSEDEIDGHDIGMREANIFILTNNSTQAFDRVKDVLSNREFWRDVRVACRETAGNQYTILWPKTCIDFKIG